MGRISSFLFGWWNRKGPGRGIVRCSGRLQLRYLEPPDWNAFRDLERTNEDWLAPWIPTPGPDRYSRERFVRQVRAAREQARQGTYHRLGIFLAEGMDLVGSVTLSGVIHGAMWGCHAGYWIASEHAGQGLMPEALCLAFDFAFRDLSLHRVQLAIMPRNVASRRVAEKLGLRDEGIARGYLKIAGKWEDHVRYAILADEYEARREDLYRVFVRPAAEGVFR
ncbi:MAG: GNAT family N-acetyltransferase [Planctomycetes bacterium]|nr:GNAT family N-acetyltransferase [Planctomycetota bacterium]